MALIEFLNAGVVDSGAARAGATVDFYMPGTLTRLTVYSTQNGADDADGTYALGTADRVLDANGRLVAYCNAPVRVVVTSTAGVTVRDVELKSQGLVTDDRVYLTTPSLAYFTPLTLQGALVALGVSFGGTDGKLKVASGTARYFKAWAADIYNVKNFGATGVGSGTADQTGIQLAMTTGGMSGVAYYFPAGTYVITSVLTFAAATNVALIGDGPGTRLKADSGATFTMLDFTGAGANILVENMRLDGAGTTSTTGNVGISFGSSCTNTTVRGCTFGTSADSTTVGLNTAIAMASTRGEITGCRFTGVKASANSSCIKLDSAADIDVSDCDLRCTDATASAAYGIAQISTAGSGRIRISNCRVDQATTVGIALLTAHGSKVEGCSVYGSGSSYGILARGGDDVRIEGCYCYGGRYGIAVDASGASGAPERVVVNGNVVTDAAYHGIFLTSAVDSSTLPTACVVNGNTVASVGRVGIFLECASNCSVTSNVVYDASTSSSGGYGAVVVSTANLAGHAGGTNNYLANNRITTISTNYARAAIEVEDYAGTGTNVNSTRLGQNDLYPLGPNAVWLRYAGANNACWNSTNGGIGMSPQMVVGRGLRIPLTFLSGVTATLSIQDSGKTFILSGACAITLPTLTAAATDQDNGAEFTFFRSGNVGAQTIDCGGANTFNNPNNVTHTLITLGGAGPTQAASLRIRGYNGTWQVQDAAPAYASALYTTSA